MDSNDLSVAAKLRDLEAEAYQIIIQSGDRGISQASLWRILGVNSRDISRIARRLENKKKIRRVRILEDGRWTYKLIRIKTIQELLDIDIPKQIDASIPNERRPEGELVKALQWQKNPELQISKLSWDRALDELYKIMNSLGLGIRTRDVANEAHAIFRKAVSIGFSIGRRSEVLMAASIYAACRRLGIPVHLSDICRHSYVSSGTINFQRYRGLVAAYYRSMRESGIFEAPLPDSSIYLDKIIDRLKTDVQRGQFYSELLTEDVRSTALRVIQKAKSLGITAGKNPAGLAATSLYVACDGRISQKIIARAAAVTEVTVRNNYRYLKEMFDELA